MNGLTPYPITPICNFLAVILALLPLLSQIRKLSLAIWGYAIWIAIYDFTMFVNNIIWHDNVNIVAPVWCDIATKFQTGAPIGTRACALVICVRLYKTTRLRASIETISERRRKARLYELLLIIGLPFLVMALYIIVQPFRFEITEELGCDAPIYSFVGYIIQYAPSLVASLGCLILAPLTLLTFLRHRKEMNEYLSSGRDLTHMKYFRLMVVACLDTLFNLPVLITLLVTDIVQGKGNPLNYPYISWKNVHDGAGGNAPGTTLSSILQTPAVEWSSTRWNVFNVKWDEWLYVLHAIMFFSLFGTTPEMRRYYRSTFWFIPERLGYKRRRVSDVETISDVAFNSNPGQQVGTANRRGNSSFLDTAIDASAIHSGELAEGNSLESGGTPSDRRRAIDTVIFAEGHENHSAGGM